MHHYFGPGFFPRLVTGTYLSHSINQLYMQRGAPSFGGFVESIEEGSFAAKLLKNRREIDFSCCLLLWKPFQCHSVQFDVGKLLSQFLPKITAFGSFLPFFHF